MLSKLKERTQGTVVFQSLTRPGYPVRRARNISLCRYNCSSTTVLICLLALLRLSTLLLRDATGDVQEGYELERNARLPTWSPHLRESQRLDIKVYAAAFSNRTWRSGAAGAFTALTELLLCGKPPCCVSGFAQTLRTGSEPWAWTRSRATCSLSRWIGSTSGTEKQMLHMNASLQATKHLMFLMPVDGFLQGEASCHLHRNQEYRRHLELWWLPWIGHPAARFVFHCWKSLVGNASIRSDSDSMTNLRWVMTTVKKQKLQAWKQTKFNVLFLKFSCDKDANMLFLFSITSLTRPS